MHPPLPSELWTTLAAEQAAEALGTDGHAGLSEAEARRRAQQWGENRLVEPPQPGLLAILSAQFRQFMVLVLLVAAALSAFLGEALDAFTILVIVVLNAILGFIQEFRAERSLQALRRLSAPSCLVVREGRAVREEAAGLVPGDVVLLEAGDRVPADARLLESFSLEVEESALTGESVPVRKDASWRAKDAAVPVADQRNMVFMGTTVTRGRGRAVVVATGMATRIGEIARLLERTSADPTPLQRRLEQLGRGVVLGCLALVALVFLAGVWQGLPVYGMFLTAVSLAVAAIPEGLPAVVTVALALGVQRMSRRNAIVRRLIAVETLGCTTVICSDKTGTLTQNAMTVVELALPNGEVQVSGSGFAPAGRFELQGKPVSARELPALEKALLVCALCNHAQVQPEPAGVGQRIRQAIGRRAEPARWVATGDPTEAALQVAAMKGNVAPGGPQGGGETPLAERFVTLEEFPFESERRRMTVVVRPKEGGAALALTKGAPEAVLGRCDRILTPQGAVAPLPPAARGPWLAAADRMALRGLRVLGLAFKPGAAPGQPEAVIESGMVFIGLVAMQDPPRPDVPQAIRVARRAGIRTLMVTGDHPRTALAIGRQLGLVHDGDAVVTGSEIEAMDDRALERRLRTVSVFARVSPVHKQRIVKALKAAGHVVAMTGDGVNDAPALKTAHIGVAMGRTGTDVTKEAAAMVLADDNYATIVSAVEEGRAIYENIRKFIRYLLACNVGEVLAMFVTAVSGMPLPLVPIQILWVNLVTDGLPALALGMDPPDPEAMHRPPRPPDEGVFARGLASEILWRGALIGLTTVAAFASALWSGAGLLQARTLAFNTLVLAQLAYVFECHGSGDRGLRWVVASNPYLLLAVGASLVMQAAVVSAGALQPFFHTQTQGPGASLAAVAFALVPSLLASSLRALRQLVGRRFSLVKA